MSALQKLASEMIEQGISAFATRISMSDVNTKLLAPATSKIQMNQAEVRALGGKPTSGSRIAMSDLTGSNDWTPVGSETLWKANVTTEERDSYTIGQRYEAAQNGIYEEAKRYTSYEVVAGSYDQRWNLYYILDRRIKKV